MLGEEGDLFGGPAAFGAYGYGVGDSRTDLQRPGRGAPAVGDGRRVYIPPFAIRLRRMGHPVGWAWSKDFLIACARLGAFEGVGEGEALFGFAEEDAGGGGFVFQGWLEGGGVGDLGDGGAAGLLAGFEGDAAPAFYSFSGGLGEMFFGAAGEDGSDAGDA